MDNVNDDLFKSYYGIGGYGSSSGLYANSNNPPMADFTTYGGNDDFGYDYNTTNSGGDLDYVDNYDSLVLNSQPSDNTNYQTFNADDYSYETPPFYDQTTNAVTYTPPNAQSLNNETTSRPNSAPDYMSKMQSVPFFGETTNSATYAWKTADRPNTSQPSSARSNSRPAETISFQGQTTHRADFVPKLATRLESYNPDNSYTHQDTIRITGNTTHRVDYVPKTAEKTVSSHQNETRGNLPPFDARTSNGIFYTPKTATRTKLTRPHSASAISDANFDDATIHRLDYVRKSAHKTSSLRPRTSSMIIHDRFNDHTESQDEFVQKYVKIERNEYRPEEAHISAAKFDETTTNLADYHKYPNSQRRTEIRPHSSRNMWNAKFDDNTTHREDYTNKYSHVCPAEILLREGRIAGYRAHGYNTEGHRIYTNGSNSNGSAGSRRNISMVQRFNQVPQGQRPMTPVETPPLPVS